MGWTYVNNASRSDIIAECVADQTLCSGDKLRTLRKSFRGNVMYSVLEIIRDGKSTKSINVTLLGRSKFGWGYKIMDECEGPCYYHCPLSFLDEADEPQNELAKSWRETVRREAAARSVAKAQKRPEPVGIAQGRDAKPRDENGGSPLQWEPAGENRWRVFNTDGATLCMIYPTFGAPEIMYAITVDGCGAYSSPDDAMRMAERYIARARDNIRTDAVDPRAGHAAPLVAQWHDAFAAIHRATEVVERLTIEADVLAALDAVEELVRARYEAVYAERLNALPPGHHQDHEGRHFPNPTTDAP